MRSVYDEQPLGLDVDEDRVHGGFKYMARTTTPTSPVDIHDHKRGPERCHIKPSHFSEL
jgi:hypothetical protein